MTSCLLQDDIDSEFVSWNGKGASARSMLASDLLHAPILMMPLVLNVSLTIQGLRQCPRKRAEVTSKPHGRNLVAGAWSGAGALQGG